MSNEFVSSAASAGPAERDTALALDVERLLRFGRKHKLVKELDVIVARNTLLDILGLLAGRCLFLHLADAFGGGLFGVFPDGGLIVQLRRAGVFRCLGLLVGGLCLCLLGLCLSVGHGGGCADEQGGNGDGKRASIAHGDYLLWK